jgi:hypothetical protein
VKAEVRIWARRSGSHEPEGAASILKDHAVPAAHELARKTSIEPSKTQKGKQSKNSKNNYLICLREYYSFNRFILMTLQSVFRGKRLQPQSYLQCIQTLRIEFHRQKTASSHIPLHHNAY